MVQHDSQVLRAALNARGLMVHPGTAHQVLTTLAAHTPHIDRTLAACQELRSEVRREFGAALCSRIIQNAGDSREVTRALVHLLTSGLVELRRDDLSIRTASLLSEEYGVHIWDMLK